MLVVSRLVPDALEAPVRSVGWLRKDVHESASGIADVGLTGPSNESHRRAVQACRV
jgi:hypothetical protein